MPSIVSSPAFLPRVMALDAASCALTGAIQVGLADTLARWTGLPSALLIGTGLFLLAYAAVAAVIAKRTPVPRALIGLIAIGNLGWAIACVALLFSGVYAVTTLGVAWLLAQAVVVVALAEAQWMGLRATRRPRTTVLA